MSFDINEIKNVYDDKQLIFSHAIAHTWFDKLMLGEKVKDWDINKVKHFHDTIVGFLKNIGITHDTDMVIEKDEEQTYDSVMNSAHNEQVTYFIDKWSGKHIVEHYVLEMKKQNGEFVKYHLFGTPGSTVKYSKNYALIEEPKVEFYDTGIAVISKHKNGLETLRMKTVSEIEKNRLNVLYLLENDTMKEISKSELVSLMKPAVNQSSKVNDTAIIEKLWNCPYFQKMIELQANTHTIKKSKTLSVKLNCDLIQEEKLSLVSLNYLKTNKNVVRVIALAEGVWNGHFYSYAKSGFEELAKKLPGMPIKINHEPALVFGKVLNAFADAKNKWIVADLYLNDENLAEQVKQKKIAVSVSVLIKTASSAYGALVKLFNPDEISLTSTPACDKCVVI